MLVRGNFSCLSETTFHACQRQLFMLVRGNFSCLSEANFPNKYNTLYLVYDGYKISYHWLGSRNPTAVLAVVVVGSIAWMGWGTDSTPASADTDLDVPPRLTTQHTVINLPVHGRSSAGWLICWWHLSAILLPSTMVTVIVMVKTIVY